MIRCIEHIEFPECGSLDGLELPHGFAVEETRSLGAAE